MFVTTRSTQPLRPLRLMLSTLLLLASAAFAPITWAQNAGTVYQCNDDGAYGRYAVDTNSVGVGVNMPNCSNMVAYRPAVPIWYCSASIPAC